MAGARPTHEACAHGASSICGYQTHATWAFTGEPSAHGASSIYGYQTDATRVFTGATVQMELAPYNAARAEAAQPSQTKLWPCRGLYSAAAE